MQVTICGQTFEIEKESRTEKVSTVTNFKVKIGEETKTLRVQYENEIVETLMEYHGIDGQKELEEILKFEIRLELYSIIRQVKLDDISSGKRLDLLPEFVREFGVGYIDIDVQETQSELITEAMKHYGE